MKAIKILIGFACVVLVAFFPFNLVYHLRDKIGTVRLTRIERKSLIQEYDTYFTPGVYNNYILLPETYVSPRYADSPFDRGCFEIAVAYRQDTVIVYQGSTCNFKNLTPTFQLIDLPNGIGELSWMKVRADDSGKYTIIDCDTGLMD